MSIDIQVVAIPQNASAMVYWTAPSNISVLYYKLFSLPDNQILYVLGDILITEVFSLKNGFPYTFKIVAVDIFGNESSPSKPSNIVIPFVKILPKPPTNLQAIAKNASAFLSWSAPVDDGGTPILEYKIITVPDNQVIYTKSLSATIFSLANGVSYHFYVIASNIIGDSKVSEGSNFVVPNFLNVPYSPTNVAANFDKLTNSITVSWSEPVWNGSTILYYKIVSIYDNQFFFTQDLSITISNVIKGKSYAFYVVAKNIIGYSPFSNLSNVIVTPNVPNPPKSLSFTLGNLLSTVTWSPPDKDGGGGPILEYILELNPGNITISVPSTTFSQTFFQLINYQTYSVSIQAVNNIGPSDKSSISFIAGSVPEPPTNIRIIYESPDFTEVILEWDPSITSSDVPVLQYFIRPTPYFHVLTVDGNTTMIHITGMSPYTGHRFTVYALNTIGFSKPSKTTEETKFILISQDIYYKKLKTGGNDPSFSKSQKYSMYIKSSLKYQAINAGGGTYT